MKPDVITVLAQLFDNYDEARALLEQIGFPDDRRPTFVDSQSFWHNVGRLIARGVLEEGAEAGERNLILAAQRIYRGNERLQEIVGSLGVHEVPSDGAAPAPEPVRETVTSGAGPAHRPPTGPPLNQASEYPTLLFTGSQQHDAFLRLVRQQLGGGELLYASQGQCAIEIDAPASVENVLRTIGRLAQQIDAGVQVTYHAYDFRPYLLRQIDVRGPDGQTFHIEGVPITSTIRQIVEAVLAEGYSEQARQRDGFRSMIVDLQRPDDQRRLNLDNTLHDVGLQERDTLAIAGRASAGAIPREQWLRAVTRARRAIEGYAAKNPRVFQIVEQDDADLPTRYIVRIVTPGFGPPRTPGEAPPVIEEHELFIMLGTDFPQTAPIVMWATPVFHPNVLSGDGLVCLGPLMEAYRPSLDFGEVCRMLVDMAGYRNYEPRRADLDSEGFVNPDAAEWALTPEGQRAIEELGGIPLTKPPADRYGTPPRQWPLRVTAKDTWHREP